MTWPPATPDLRTPAPRRKAASERHVTLHDVGRVAGVSAMTVWRALNHADKVPPTTVARVREAVASTGYVPNLVAGGLRSSKSSMVAALVPTVSAPVFLETIEALTGELEQRGYQLMLGQIGYQESREEVLLDTIIGRRPDGILLTGVLHSPQSRRRLKAARIPVVETWDLTDDPIDMVVGFSHEAVGASVARFLHARGRRRIALIGGDDVRGMRRIDACAAQAVAQGQDIVPRRSVVPPGTIGQGRAALRSLIEEDARIDSIFCTSDMLALGVLTEARSLGLDIPRQLAVVGFGDMVFARDLEPALTTVRIDGARIARLAADFIIHASEGTELLERVVDIGFCIVERDSA